MTSMIVLNINGNLNGIIDILNGNVSVNINPSPLGNITVKLTEAEFATFQTNQANIGAVSSTTSSSSASGGDGMSCAKDASEFWTFLSRAYKNIC